MIYVKDIGIAFAEVLCHNFILAVYGQKRKTGSSSGILLETVSRMLILFCILEYLES